MPEPPKATLDEPAQGPAPADVAGGERRGAGDAAPQGGAASPDGAPEDAAPRTSRLFYGLGLGLQTFLWFLLFLAIVIAVAVGGDLTEFRYVGF